METTSLPVGLHQQAQLIRRHSRGFMTRNIKLFSDGIEPEGRYANFFRIGHNAVEFVLEFGQCYRENERPHINNRIITIPIYAKTLLETLQSSIKKYEMTYGTIKEE